MRLQKNYVLDDTVLNNNCWTDSRSMNMKKNEKTKHCVFKKQNKMMPQAFSFTYCCHLTVDIEKDVTIALTSVVSLVENSPALVFCNASERTSR